VLKLKTTPPPKTKQKTKQKQNQKNNKTPSNIFM